MTSEDVLLAALSASPDASARARARRCLGLPGAPCAALVDRMAPEGRCRACGTAKEAAERAMDLRRSEESLLAALPELHRRATFGSSELSTWCRDTAAVQRAEQLVAVLPRDVRTVLLSGPTSAGKSSLAAAMVQAIQRGPSRRASVQWVDVRSIASARHMGIDAAPLVRRTIGAGVTVFDDLAKDLTALEYEVQTLIGAIEFRHARLPDMVPEDALTIVTTEREVRTGAGASAGQGDLLSFYPLSFVRRIAGEWTEGSDGEVARGSAVVIRVRRGP